MCARVIRHIFPEVGVYSEEQVTGGFRYLRLATPDLGATHQTVSQHYSNEEWKAYK